MGQPNLERTEFRAFQTVLTKVASTRQTVASTAYFAIGDLVDVVDVDNDGNIISILAQSQTVAGIDPGAAIILGASVDTTVATVNAQIRSQAIQDGQSAVDRLYKNPPLTGSSAQFTRKEPIVTQALNTPSAGQTTYYIADASFFAAGDTVEVVSNSGLLVSTTVTSVNKNAADAVNNYDSLVIPVLADTSALVSPALVNQSLTVQQAITRVGALADLQQAPVDGEYVGQGDSNNQAFALANLAFQGSTRVHLDGVRKRKGTAGTRAALTQGTGNSANTFTSLILGTQGNKNKVAIVAGAGTTVTVTGGYTAGYTVSVNNSAGAATAAQIAAAINADPKASRIMLAQFGGTGAGVAAAFAATALAGGLNNGTGDYAELEQVFNNLIVSTGFKWISFWSLPNNPDRMNRPPRDDEELIVDYRQTTDV